MDESISEWCMPLLLLGCRRGMRRFRGIRKSEDARARPPAAPSQSRRARAAGSVVL
jgi:hypothetical protein